MGHDPRKRDSPAESGTVGRYENVRAFFEKEKACKSTINRMAVVKRTAEATELSERTIRDIHKGHVARDGQLLTPVKRYTTSGYE